MLLSWADFKALVDDRGIHFIKFDQTDYYSLIGFDGPLEVRCDLIPGGADDTEYLADYAAKEGSPIAPKTVVGGLPKVAVYEPEGSFKTYISHNFCDPTTWYQESIEVNGESLTLDTGTTYTFSHTNVIDVEHGKVSGEKNYSYDFDAGANTETLRSQYSAKIYIDGALQSSGYSINYAAGTVTFDAAPGGAVTADYHYASGSRFTVAAEAGQTIQIEHVELQFTTDISVSSALIKEVRITDPSSPPAKLVVEHVEHLNEYDVINTGNQGQGFIPQHGSLASDILVFPCTYGRTIDLRGDQGADMSIRLQNDTPLTGTFATITFYTSSEES